MNKNIPDSQLKELFKQITLEKPSPALIEAIMVEIEKEKTAQTKRLKRIMILQVAAGIIGMISIPVILYFLGFLSIPQLHLSFPSINSEVLPIIISVALPVLLLLIVNIFLNKKVINKEMKSS